LVQKLPEDDRVVQNHVGHIKENTIVYVACASS